MQPQPWPLPPPRVTSQEPDENTLTPRILDASDSNAAEVNVSSLKEEIKEVESGAASSAPFDADCEVFMKSSLQQEHEVHARESESNHLNVGPLTLNVPFPIAQCMEIRQSSRNLTVSFHRSTLQSSMPSM